MITPNPPNHMALPNTNSQAAFTISVDADFDFGDLLPQAQSDKTAFWPGMCNHCFDRGPNGQVEQGKENR